MLWSAQHKQQHTVLPCAGATMPISGRLGSYADNEQNPGTGS